MSGPNKATMLARLVGVKSSGSEGNIVKDIVFLDKNGKPVTFATDTYTDAKAVAAVKAKSQIAALTALETSADLATIVQKVNDVIAALKA